MYNKERFFLLARRLGTFRPAVSAEAPVRWAWWEWPLLLVAIVITLSLGLSKLGIPSLWHDELVHVHVAKSIAATGWPTLPSGNFYPSSTAYNCLLALFVGVFGDEAFWVRLPSVLLAGINVGLLYVLCRTFLGRNVAIIAVFCFAASPWHIAWARQARLYEFQLLSYLAFVFTAWQWYTVPDSKRARLWGLASVCAYVVGVLTSFHSILYLGPVGGYAILCTLQERRLRSRYATAIAVCTLLGVLSILWFRFNPNPVDRAAVFETGIGGLLLDYLRTDRFLYLRFLANNLSTGFLFLAFLGTGLLLGRGARKGLFVLLAFWVPVLILTFLVGYRRPRFMYFAYPVYVMLCSVGFVWLVAFLPHGRRSWFHAVGAFAVLLFFARLSLSVVDLTKHSLDTASGAHETLARKQPQWKKPTAWLKAHRTDETIITTTFLPVYHYVGHVDNWFPNRYQRWERQESGLEGLGSLDAFRSYLQEHPKGFFIAESSRFEMWRWHGDLTNDLGLEVSWVESNMTFLDEASSADVHVWAWDFTEGVPE